MKRGGWRRKPANDPLKDVRSGGGTDTGGSVASCHTSVLRHETEAAGLVGGRRHAGSGAMAGLKSDGSSERYQIEAKQTQHQQISLKLEWLNKVTREAICKVRVPLLHIRFLNVDPGMEQDWVCVPSGEFKKLFDLARGADSTLGRWEGYGDGHC